MRAVTNSVKCVYGTKEIMNLSIYFKQLQQTLSLIKTGQDIHNLKK